MLVEDEFHKALYTDSERSCVKMNGTHLPVSFCLAEEACPLALGRIGGKTNACFRSELNLDTWLQQLLFLAADSYAARDVDLQMRALDAFSVCLKHSKDQQASLALGIDDVLRN